MKSKLFIFLILNFTALAIGGLSTGSGVTSDWYAQLNKAPWTPPGWVFGFAWTIIMICFAVYMAKLWMLSDNKKRIVGLFGLQWILNVSWNPVFFSYQKVGLAMLLILLLTVLIGYFLFNFWKQLKYYTLLVFPYFIWLMIATSLNAFILFMN